MTSSEKLMEMGVWVYKDGWSSSSLLWAGHGSDQPSSALLPLPGATLSPHIPSPFARAPSQHPHAPTRAAPQQRDCPWLPCPKGTHVSSSQPHFRKGPCDLPPPPPSQAGLAPRPPSLGRAPSPPQLSSMTSRTKVTTEAAPFPLCSTPR